VSTIIFSALTLTAGRKLSNMTIDFFAKKSLPEPASSFTFACALGLVFGTVTQALGIHALFGFFLAGIVVGEAKNLKEETRTIISQMVYSLFIPVFFVNIGLKIDFAAHFDLAIVAIVTLVGVAGRFIGAWVGASLSTVPRINRVLVSLAHVPGGMMEIVVALLAFNGGLITETIFIAIVFGAVFTSVIIGPLMRAALGLRKEIKILSYLKFDSKLAQLSGDLTKQDALVAMIALIPKYYKAADIIDITSDIIERERNYSTAVGEGIAIPHVKVPGLTNPVLLFAKSQKGIDWNAPDGKPVHFIFFLFSPTNENDLHVQFLAKIIQKMQSGDNRAALSGVAPDQLLPALEQVFA
jgi:mannitol/fructose-specific phosphotransferase system IIA component (Ntr-type)